MRHQKAIPVPYLQTLRDEVISTQRLVIEKQSELIRSYKYILKSKEFFRNNRYSEKQKAEIILKVESSSKSVRTSLKELGISRGTFYYWRQRLKKKGGIQGFSEIRRYKYEEERFKEAVFSILHSPLRDFGFNRTSWRLPDIHSAMITKGLPIGHNYISKIIKNAGYRFRSAKKVLTSTDPNYKEKLKLITQILSKLRKDEKFFSIDEFGPFSIKIQGGKSYVPPSKARVVPQIQKSKGV